MNNLLEVIRNNGEIHTRLLELLVYKAFDRRPVDQAWQLPLKSTPPQAETVSTRPKTNDLEKRGGSSSRSHEADQKVETTSIDMTEVQWMINSAMEKGSKFLKFIHQYPAYMEKFEYPKGFRIPDFSLFAGESSLSSLEHVARFTAQCGYVNCDFHKLRLFNFSLTGSAFAWYINLLPNSI
ncbi:hypothetical protein EV1_024148 [Malus domestica]